MDLEREQGCRPVARLRPRRDGVGDCEVDEFPGGLSLGKCPLVLIALRSCRFNASIAFVVRMKGGGCFP